MRIQRFLFKPWPLHVVSLSRTTMPVSAPNLLVTPDTDHLIFGIDLDDRHPFPLPWDNYTDIEPDIKQPPLTYDFGPPQQSLFIPLDNNLDDIGSWINDPADVPPSPASPPSFSPFPDFPPPDQTFSPTTFAALHPLPRSVSPSSPFEDTRTMRPRVRSVVSPAEISLQTPSWVGQLWESTSPTTPTGSSSLSSALRSPSSLTRPSLRHSPLTTDATVRQNRIPIRRSSLSSMQLFQSASAPTTHTESSISMMARNFSSRADSVGDDRDATLRPSRRKRSPETDTVSPSLTISTCTVKEDPPLKSVLRPPKLAPSAWQLYFTDWIQRQQSSGTRKLNVAQAAKEAGQEYALLSHVEKEPYKRRSQAMKEAREKEHDAYMRSLSPEDIKRENAFRAAQRKAGKSRKSNLKDRNAPKKPLSAYFMFLQQIRANPTLVVEIFGDETETTKQSVLAAAKWRSMTDAERQPFLAQAEQEKMEYEAARRVYEEGANPGFNSNINFSILPGSPHFSIVKTESSESESEGFTTDDGSERPVRS